MLKTVSNILVQRERVYGLLSKSDHSKENKRQFAEVFTPLNVVENVLDMLPGQTWKNKDLRWFEPAVGIGNFIVPVYFRLMEGLSDAIPDVQERSTHIIRNMLYMSEINPKNVNICKKIFGTEANIYTGDTLSLDTQDVWGVEYFDIVFGNPPYHESMKGNGSTSPLYNRFIERLIDRCMVMLMIIPSRWFGAGKGLSSFRKMMLSRKDIKIINHCGNSTAIFPKHNKIMGGVCIIYKDASYNGYCRFNCFMCDLNKYDILVEPVYQTIIDKVLIKMEESLSSICTGQNYTGIRSNDPRLLDKYDDTVCYVSDNIGVFKYVSSKHLHNRDFNRWKVFTVEANGYWNYFGKTFIGTPYDVCNQSYIVFEVGSLEEATSLVSYMNTIMVNFMMGIRKFSQHISPDTCKWIPLLPLDRVFTDSYLYAYFNLDVFEIEFLEVMYRNKILKKMIKDLQFLGRLIDEHVHRLQS